jgi:hypothetical protein
MIARRRGVLTVALIGAVAAIAAVTLGAASGEGPAGSTAARRLSVQGVGTLPIGVGDSAAQATAVYREGMAKALADGQAKAAFLAEKSGIPLGAAVTIVEDGGSIECTGAYEEEGSAAYARYEGEQPDFGWGHDPGVLVGPSGSAVAPTSSVAPARGVSHRPKAKKRKKAHKASTSTVRCNLTANVSAIYALG